MTREQLEKNLGREVEVRLFDGTEITGVLRKTGETDFKNDPNLYLPQNYYFLTEKGTNVCKSCLFRVSHIQNYKTLR